MTTIILVENARFIANKIHEMMAMPDKIILYSLSGGTIQFSCENKYETIRNSSFVNITYKQDVQGGFYESIKVSSVYSID